MTLQDTRDKVVREQVAQLAARYLLYTDVLATTTTTTTERDSIAPDAPPSTEGQS